MLPKFKHPDRNQLNRGSILSALIIDAVVPLSADRFYKLSRKWGYEGRRRDFEGMVEGMVEKGFLRKEEGRYRMMEGVLLV